MPILWREHDGLWLADQLRAGFPETVVLMTTGVLEFNAAVHSLQSGVADYLVKPFPRERLTDALRRACFVHRSRRSMTDMQRELDERRAQIAAALDDLEINAAASLEAMLAMLRVRDAQSYDHAHRVAKLSVSLAKALSISDLHLSDIERAALLHNLGRVALPDQILIRKERSLSADERATLRSYPLHGQAMLKNVPFLAAASEIAVAAHERYDGSGFPRGLKGEAIPLGARVIAVADVWDELVSGIGDTPVALAHALDIMTSERLPHFDPLALGALTMLQLSASLELPAPWRHQYHATWLVSCRSHPGHDRRASLLHDGRRALVPISLQIFIAPDVLDAPSCRRVQAAMDAGTPEPAEVLADGFELQHDVRRATQIEIADTVLAMVDAALDRVRIPIASFYGLVLQSREGASIVRYETGGFYKPHVDRAHVASWPLTAKRQITIVLFVESSRDAEPSGGFTGGILRLFPHDGEPIDIIPTGGTLVAFPAAMPHEVTRVTSGRRDTIVDWFY